MPLFPGQAAGHVTVAAGFFERVFALREEVYGPSLMLEFVRLAFNTPGVFRRTLLILVFDQMHNFYFLLTTYLSIYMVNTLFAQGPETEGHLLVPGSPATINVPPCITQARAAASSRSIHCGSTGSLSPLPSGGSSPGP